MALASFRPYTNTPTRSVKFSQFSLGASQIRIGGQDIVNSIEGNLYNTVNFLNNKYVQVQVIMIK